MADAAPTILVSVPEQRMVLIKNGVLIGHYRVSTSKYGLGDRPSSYATPLGSLEVAAKVGAAAPLGAVFKRRRFTGEILRPNAPGRDPIVTRILHLRGLEACNSRAFSRGIYIHGTPAESKIGRPASYGCIRMRSRDVMRVFDAAPGRNKDRNRQLFAATRIGGVGLAPADPGRPTAGCKLGRAHKADGILAGGTRLPENKAERSSADYVAAEICGKAFRQSIADVSNVRLNFFSIISFRLVPVFGWRIPSVVV